MHKERNGDKKSGRKTTWRYGKPGERKGNKVTLGHTTATQEKSPLQETEEKYRKLYIMGEEKNKLSWLRTFSWRALGPWTQPEHIGEEQGD